MSKKALKLLPIFDSAKKINSMSPPKHVTGRYIKSDFKACWLFLKQYDCSEFTYANYRNRIEVLCQWSWLVRKKSILKFNKDDLEEFFKFYQHPPITWISNIRQQKFKEKDGERIYNENWRPFLKKKNSEHYESSYHIMKSTIVIANIFYKFLVDEEFIQTIPLRKVRQINRFIIRNTETKRIKRLSAIQWKYITETARKMAENDPRMHERTLFIVSACYSLYLRISELKHHDTTMSMTYGQEKTDKQKC